MGSRHHRRGRVRSLELGWRCVPASGDESWCSVVLERVSPSWLVAEITAIASVLRMLQAPRVSIPLTVHSDSEYALEVVLGDDPALSELPLVQLARTETRHNKQRADIEGRHVTAYKEHAGNEAADRVTKAGRRRLMVPERAAKLISCAEAEPRSIAWDQGRGRPPKAFPVW